MFIVKGRVGDSVVSARWQILMGKRVLGGSLLVVSSTSMSCKLCCSLRGVWADCSESSESASDPSECALGLRL